MVPKRALDVPACEIARFLKLTPKDMVIPISMQVLLLVFVWCVFFFFFFF
jgi:hypothetical protein